MNTDLHGCVVATCLRARSGCCESRVFRRRTAPWLQRRTLFFVEKPQVGFVASVFHLFDWNEMESGRVNHVTLASGRIRVGKDMAKASVTSLGAHLGSLHLI